jgi:DNA repair protein RadC
MPSTPTDAPSIPIRRHLWRYELRRTRVPCAADAVAQYDNRQITHALAVATIFRAVIGDAPREHFVAFYLDARHRIMGLETIAIGGTAVVQVEIAEVFRGVLLAGSSRLLVAHNHPSNDCQPSEADKNTSVSAA